MCPCALGRALALGNCPVPVPGLLGSAQTPAFLPQTPQLWQPPRHCHFGRSFLGSFHTEGETQALPTLGSAFTPNEPFGMNSLGPCWCHPRGIPGWIRVPSEGAAPGQRQGGHSLCFWEEFQSRVCLDLGFVPKHPVLSLVFSMELFPWEMLMMERDHHSSNTLTLQTPFSPISFPLQLLEDGFV